MLTYYCSYQFDKDFSKLKLLLAQGYDINTKESNGNSLAHVAAYNGGCNILTFLLENGADIDQPNNEGITLINIFGTQLGSEPSSLLNKPSLPYTNSLKQACSNQYDESLIPILKYSKGEIGSASPQELVESAAMHGKLLDLLSYVNDSVFQRMKVIILAPYFLNRHHLTLDRANDLIKKSRVGHNNESLEIRELLNDSYKKLGGLADLMKFFYYEGDKAYVVEKNEHNKQSFKRS